jgi:hypothetical protein
VLISNFARDTDIQTEFLPGFSQYLYENFMTAP